MKNWNTYIYILALLFNLSLSSCVNKMSIELKKNLSISGYNKSELEKLLSHYKTNSSKREASKFLVSNMNDFFSYNIELYKVYEPFYLQCDSLFKESNLEYDYIIGKRNDLMGRKIDSLWLIYNSKITANKVEINKLFDL